MLGDSKCHRRFDEKKIFMTENRGRMEIGNGIQSVASSKRGEKGEGKQEETKTTLSPTRHEKNEGGREGVKAKAPSPSTDGRTPKNDRQKETRRKKQICIRFRPWPVRF